MKNVAKTRQNYSSRELQLHVQRNDISFSKKCKRIVYLQKFIKMSSSICLSDRRRRQGCAGHLVSPYSIKVLLEFSNSNTIRNNY